MRKKSLHVLAGSFCMVLAWVVLSLIGTSSHAAGIKWDIAGKPVGSSGYVNVQAFSRVVSKYNDDITLTAVPSRNDAQRLRMLDSGEVTLAEISPLNARRAHMKLAPFDKKPIVHPPYFVGDEAAAWNIVLTKKNRTDIKTIADLKGKKVCLCTGGVYDTAKKVFQAIGMWDQIKPMQIKWTDISSAMVENRVDATIGYTMSGASTIFSSWILEFLSRAEVKVVPWSEKELSIIASEEVPGTSTAPCPKKGWKEVAGQDIAPGMESFPAFVFTVNTFALPSANADVIYRYVKTLIEHGAEVAKLSNSSKEYASVKELAKVINTSINCWPKQPIHPGAARAYKEFGIWENHWIIGK